MKKQSFLLSTLLVMAPGLYAATMNDVMNQLLSAGQLLYNSALGTRHISTMSAWQQAFDKAKIFVTDNSKNLVGSKDSIIIASMTELEQVNKAFVNALNTISKTLPKAPISQLLPVAMNAKKAYDKIYPASFTLGGKNDAKKVLIHLSRFLEDASKKLYDNLLVKGDMGGIIPTPPNKPAPAVPNKPAPTPSKETQYISTVSGHTSSPAVGSIYYKYTPGTGVVYSKYQDFSEIDMSLEKYAIESSKNLRDFLSKIK